MDTVEKSCQFHILSAIKSPQKVAVTQSNTLARTYRIKLKYKSFEIELEGEDETVQAEFKDIKQNGLGNIVHGYPPYQTHL